MRGRVVMGVRGRVVIGVRGVVIGLMVVRPKRW